MVKAKTGDIPDSHFENDLDFDVKDSDKKYSKETLDKLRQMTEKLKQQQSKE